MISVTVKKKPVRERTYPWIGTTEDGLVVLFYEERCGTVLSSTDLACNPVGLYHEEWAPDYFTPFEGALTLQNSY